MNCKVIATSVVNGRDVRTPQSRSVTFPDHYQDADTGAKVIEMVENHLRYDAQFDAGVPVDTIIVNTQRGDSFAHLDGKKTRNGRIRVLEAQINGWSFGAYHVAVTHFPEYEHYLFTEDDIYVGGPNYYQNLVKRWKHLEEAHARPGFISLVRVMHHHYGIHAAGGIGFSSKKVLDAVIEKHGMLPHHNEKDDPKISKAQNKQNHIRNGEVAFTNTIFEMGYHLFDYGPNDNWNLEQNLSIPMYDYKPCLD